MYGIAGSYSEDPVTGKITLIDRTAEAPRPAAPAEPPPAQAEPPAAPIPDITE